MPDEKHIPIRLTFVDADPSQREPATVDAFAQTTVARLRDQGETLTPVATGAKSPAEVFAWLVQAATVATPILTLANLSLTVAQLLTEIRKLRTPESTAPPPPPVIVVVQMPGAQAAVRSDEALSNDEVLARLMDTLPEHLDATQTEVIVQVPPKPPQEL